MSFERKRYEPRRGDIQTRSPRHRLRKQISAPTDIPDCAIWLDAQLGVTAHASKFTVTGWADQSGNGRDMAVKLPRDWLVDDWSGSNLHYGNWTVAYDPGGGKVMYSSDTERNSSTPPTNWTALAGNNFKVWDVAKAYVVGNWIFNDVIAGTWVIYRCLVNDTGTEPGTDSGIWQEVSAGAMVPVIGDDAGIGGLKAIQFDVDYTGNLGDRMDTGILATPFGKNASSWFVLYKHTEFPVSPPMTSSFIIDMFGNDDVYRRALRTSNATIVGMENWLGWTGGSSPNFSIAQLDKWVLTDSTFLTDNATFHLNKAYKDGVLGGDSGTSGVSSGNNSAVSTEPHGGIILGDRNVHGVPHDWWFDGKLAVVIAYDRVIASDEQLAVREYILRRYMLPG